MLFLDLPVRDVLAAEAFWSTLGATRRSPTSTRPTWSSTMDPGVTTGG